MSFLLNKNKDENKIITLSTCWYILKSKFNVKTYLSWITNLLSFVDNFNLVIYTDVSSLKHFVHLIDFSNKKIKIIISPIEEFYTYKYKDSWIKNHEKSNLKLHSHIDWKLNMLWNEKVFFVNETIKKKYFNTLYYGWCDIGYFRNRPNDLHCDYLKNWPNNQKLLDGFFNEKIHYACVQNDKSIYLNLQNDIITHYSNKLESHSPIQPTTQIEEICFAGGFFILKKNLIDNYIKLYDEKLIYYFTNNFIIKDDQTIIMDIIFTNPNLFSIHTEDTNFDNWFMFQRLLL
jgi:hypothetical protein